MPFEFGTVLQDLVPLRIFTRFLVQTIQSWEVDVFVGEDIVQEFYAKLEMCITMAHINPIPIATLLQNLHNKELRIMTLVGGFFDEGFSKGAQGGHSL